VGAGEWRVEKPVFPGDTIYAMVTPSELTTTSKGGNLLEILVEVYARRGGAEAASAEDPRVMRFNLRFLVKDPA
jgi:acyl dehydratase